MFLLVKHLSGRWPALIVVRVARFPPRESGCPTIKLCVVASQAPVRALTDGRVVIEAMSSPRVSPPRMSMLKAHHPEVFVERRCHRDLTASKGIDRR